LASYLARNPPPIVPHLGDDKRFPGVYTRAVQRVSRRTHAYGKEVGLRVESRWERAGNQAVYGSPQEEGT
jgi:hypothetical protein